MPQRSILNAAAVYCRSSDIVGGLRRAVPLRAAARASSGGADYAALRVRELKKLLAERSIPAEGLFDKESIVQALEQADSASAGGGSAGGSRSEGSDHGGASGASGLPPHMSCALRWEQAASLFAGVRTQQGEYVALALEFQGGGEGTFVVDTAASSTLLTPAAEARLQPAKTGVTAGPGVAGTGATAASYQVALGAARLAGGGEALLPALNAVVMELPTGAGTSGILGLDFLNAFDAVELDWRERPGKARFVARNACTAASWAALTDGLSEALLRPIGMGLLAADVDIGGVRMPALLDTGAAFSTLNDAAAAAVGLKGDSGIEPMWVTGASGAPVAMRVAERDVSIECAGVGMAARPLLGELPAFATLGLGGNGTSQPAALLGLDALLTRPRMVLSTATRRMLL